MVFQFLTDVLKKGLPMVETNVVKSSAFNGVEELLEALKKSPQEKQGAFRVATWRMVIELLLELKNQVGNVEIVAANAELAAKDKPDIDAIKQAIENNLQDKMNADEADTILF